MLKVILTKFQAEAGEIIAEKPSEFSTGRSTTEHILLYKGLTTHATHVVQTYWNGREKCKGYYSERNN